MSANITRKDSTGNVLTVTYKKNKQGRDRLEPIQVQRAQSINSILLANVWIGDFPAEYLRSFRSHKMPEDLTFEMQDESIWISTKNWEWYRHKYDFITITITDWDGKEFSMPVISTLKVLGLKKLIKTKHLQGYDTVFEKYPLFYEGYELEGTYTLDECGITDQAGIHLKHPTESTKGPSHLQLDTGGSYISIKEFDAYCTMMRSKTNIVCKIERNDKGHGTGFLIGKNRIMTNAHVFPNESDLQGAKAIFLCHGEKSENIEVFLKERICSSPSRAYDKPTPHYLDYFVAQFDFKGTKEQEKVMTRLSSEADDFFKIPLLREPKQRANIIQHPKGRPKEIAFRENHARLSQLRVHYKSFTDEGSSGSPVINDRGEFIGLHVSECMEIEYALFKKREELFAALKLGDWEIDKERYYSFTEDVELQFYFKSPAKGSWIRGKIKGDLRKLIVNRAKVADLKLDDLIANKQRSRENSGKMPFSDETASLWAAGTWARQFLESLKDSPLQVDKTHILCNVAINSVPIIKDYKKKMEKSETTKPSVPQEIMQGTSLFSDYKYILGLAVAIAVIGGSVIWFNRTSILNKAFSRKFL